MAGVLISVLFFLRGGEEGQREKVRENLKEVPPPVQSPMWGLIS